jgi:hypothetical protein
VTSDRQASEATAWFEHIIVIPFRVLNVEKEATVAEGRVMGRMLLQTSQQEPQSGALLNNIVTH